MKTLRIFFYLAAAAAVLPAQTSSAGSDISPDTRALLDRVTPGALRKDLSFLASDAMAGRFTPSPQLDKAAEFIAGKFRESGLAGGGEKGSYFQTAAMTERRLPPKVTSMRIGSGARTFAIPPEETQPYRIGRRVSVRQTPLILFSEARIELLQGRDMHGKVALLLQPDYQKMSSDEARGARRAQRAFAGALEKAGASMLVVAAHGKAELPKSTLLSSERAEQTPMAIVFVTSPALRSWTDGQRTGGQGTISVEIPAPEDKQIQARNVIAVLRGNDPRLKDTYVLLTAHYDHVGTLDTAQGMAMPSKRPANGDRIYNGANDDGSGTVSVIEIARALAASKQRPRRSIVFMTFFGEERGELGSEYYGQHPLFPLKRTVADINLEQIGRTDASTGPQVNTASLTGFDYSEVTDYVRRAGQATGVRIYKDAQASDAYFTQSDNSALADLGVPAHSLTVAFEFPDYHGLGDEWQKIDYANMARVDRTVTLALWQMANDAHAPVWNAANPRTEPFRKAQAAAKAR